MRKTLLVVLLVAMATALLLHADAGKKSSLFTFQQSFLGQVGSLPQTVLFTPTEDQDLMVGVYVEQGPPFAVGYALGWTDNVGAQAVSAGGVQIIHAKAGMPVTVETNAGSSTTPYSVYVTAIGQ